MLRVVEYLDQGGHNLGLIIDDIVGGCQGSPPRGGSIRGASEFASLDRHFVS